ncbi:TPA: M48 family metallopeptidase, partial [Pseudomonas aeruginosa]
MKGTVHPRRLLLCLVLVPALLAGLGAWQSWRAEQQAERLGAAQQRVERALAEARALPPRASVRVDGRAYVRDLALARLDERLADTRSAQRLNRFAAVLADSGACLAALVAVLGAVSLAGIAGAARSALRSRRCLLLWFELGRCLLPCLLLAQIGLLALALACAGTFEILGLWRVGQVPVSEGRTQLSVALILLGLLASAWQMLAKISRLRLRPAPALDVIGRRLGEEDAPELWTLLRELAARLDTPAPQHLLVGLCDGFYVTANRVCLQPSGEHLEGRSLYLSLPLLGLLDRAELSAVIAHELAHFAGRDAHYSLHFLPIYQGAASQLAAIEEQEANVFERAALEPARLLAGYFLERFGLAVNHWSRLREFAADRRAAQLAGAPAMASALLR